MNFGEMLSKLIKGKDLTQRQFADKVGCSATYPGLIIQGRRPPPLDSVEKWADFFSLHDKARRKFIDAANLAHGTDYLRSEIPRIRAEVDAVRDTCEDFYNLSLGMIEVIAGFDKEKASEFYEQAKGLWGKLEDPQSLEP